MPYHLCAAAWLGTTHACLLTRSCLMLRRGAAGLGAVQRPSTQVRESFSAWPLTAAKQSLASQGHVAVNPTCCCPPPPPSPSARQAQQVLVKRTAPTYTPSNASVLLFPCRCRCRPAASAPAERAISPAACTAEPAEAGGSAAAAAQHSRAGCSCRIHRSSS
jgi:hypothetical protein